MRSHTTSNQDRLVDIIHDTLAVSFAPARMVLPWNGSPFQLPGFQVVATRVNYVIVQHLWITNATQRTTRESTLAMLARYRAVLTTEGWQIQIVDERGRTPYLLCTIID
jgi:hypothetical protein